MVGPRARGEVLGGCGLGVIFAIPRILTGLGVWLAGIYKEFPDLPGFPGVGRYRAPGRDVGVRGYGGVGEGVGRALQRVFFSLSFGVACD